MNVLRWEGPPPPKPLIAALLQQEWAISDRPPRAVVVSSAGGKPPGPKTAGVPWIWLTATPPSPAAILAAADRGALDVVSTAERRWEERLLARLGECTVEETPPTPPPGFIAHSPSAKELLWKLHRAAQTSMPVLLTGETGTGKELAARMIHQWSSRRARTFVPINCAAIPNELMEGELFGYAKGAFSGAVREYAGLVQAAEGGTVFLDEIDDTPYALQVKLLRVLEDRVISRLGESEWHEVNFRVLAATNRDLRALIAQGTFGADLYERLATLEIHLPPLRNRLEDLPALTQALIDRYFREDEAARRRTRVTHVTPEALTILAAYPWPGNVRELRNVIFRALVEKHAGDTLLVSDLPRRLWKREAHEPEAAVISAREVERQIAAGTMNLLREVEGLERLALTAALRRANGNASEAARLLGEVGRGAAKDPGGTVRTMMRRLGLRPGALPAK